ncbi:MAG: thiamine diphosphokinase [Eubacteriales bacterium]|nr:thiamine diphosphokinase [Eubacteriales bacterium]
MNTCYIVGAGDFTARGLAPVPGDCVLAADGGYTRLRALGIAPDLLVGDMDSLERAPEGIALLRFPREKDDTDMGLALREGWARGYRRFRLYGALGGRLDHTLGNLQLLARYARQGADAAMIGADCDAYALVDGTLTLPEQPEGALVSVLCHGERAEGVTLRGLKYPLTDALLTCDFPIGVSNERLRGPASVTVARGTLIVLCAAP